MTISPPPGTPTKRSAEVRWFYEGEPPPAVRAWFQGVDGRERGDSTRADVYLRTGRDDLNIKKREGRLEEKRRTGEGQVQELAPGVAGVVERWEKWSVPVEAGALAGAGDSRWVRVEKARRLCTFRKEGERVVRLRSPEEPGPTCNLELTRLSVEGARWWSICLEAAGRAEVLEDVLLRTAGHVFRLHAPPPLGVEDSYSYAAWLLRL